MSASVAPGSTTSWVSCSCLSKQMFSPLFVGKNPPRRTEPGDAGSHFNACWPCSRLWSFLRLITCWISPGVAPAVKLSSRVSFVLPAAAVTAGTSSSRLFHIWISGFISELCFLTSRKGSAFVKVVWRSNAYFPDDLSHVNSPVSSSKLNFINFEACLSLQMIYWNLFLLSRLTLKIQRNLCSAFENQFKSTEWKQR